MIVEGVTADELQELAIATLVAANTLAAGRVEGPRDWPTRPELFPLLLVQAPREIKRSVGRGLPQFNTTITLVVVGRLVGSAPEIVATGLRQLKSEVESALLCTPSFMQPIQQFISIETQTSVTAESKQHIGEIGMTLEVEVYQVYEPNGAVPLIDLQGTITNGAGGGTLAIFDTPFSP